MTSQSSQPPSSVLLLVPFFLSCLLWLLSVELGILEGHAIDSVILAGLDHFLLTRSAF